jgi:hypothetical protein
VCTFSAPQQLAFKEAAKVPSGVTDENEVQKVKRKSPFCALKLQQSIQFSVFTQQTTEKPNF